MREPHKVIVRPVITEKSMDEQAEHNVYTFIVAEEATKPEVRNAVESLWDVKVLDVRTARYAGKYRRGYLGPKAWRNPFIGRRADFKKARVKLAEGDHIELYEIG